MALNIGTSYVHREERRKKAAAAAAAAANPAATPLGGLDAATANLLRQQQLLMQQQLLQQQAALQAQAVMQKAVKTQAAGMGSQVRTHSSCSSFCGCIMCWGSTLKFAFAF
jgi:hypothetical protein